MNNQYIVTIVTINYQLLVTPNDPYSCIIVYIHLQLYLIPGLMAN